MKKLMAAALAILFCLSLAACNHGSNAAPDKERNSETASSDVQPENAVDFEDDSTPMTVEAQYGLLFYPAKWNGLLVTSESVADEIDSVIFAAAVNGQEYNLFKVIICDAEGDSVGTVTDDAGQTRNVFVDIPELPDLSDLNEDEQNQLYAMQEAVNVLIENLQ